MERPSAAEFAAVARAVFGIEADATPLVGELDWNARLDVGGVPRYVLKVHDPDADEAWLELQDSVLRHLGAPRLVATGQSDLGGRRRRVRLLEWVEGRVWSADDAKHEARCGALGGAVARLDRVLGSFEHPKLDRAFRWNMLQAPTLLRGLPLVDEQLRPYVLRTLERFRDEVLPRLETLPSQAIHNDANENNVLVTADGDIAGIIDVGDIVRAPRVCGLAVALSYVQLGTSEPSRAAAAVLAGYHAEWPLTPDEVELLPDLIDTRLAMSIVNAAEQQHGAPDNDYLRISQEPIRWLLTEPPDDLRLARFRDTCGYRASPTERQVVRWLLSADCAPASMLRHDVSQAPVIDWSSGGPIERTRSESGSAVIVGRYLEDREVYRSAAFAPSTSDGERRTVHLGVDLFVPAGEEVFAPLDGVVVASDYRPDQDDYGGVVLLAHQTGDGTPFWLLVGHLAKGDHVVAGQPLSRGERIGFVGTQQENGGWPPHIHVQLFTTLLGRTTDLPGVARRGDLDLWESICPDPNLLLRMPRSTSTGRARNTPELARRRRTTLSSALSVSYAEPLHIVAGEGSHLIDADGNRFLDLVNNVCHVGHAHPRVVQAMSEQAAVLNTNTRYLHPNIVEYARRLAATFPDPLSVVFLTNSGSEANDLALRLARTATGREPVFVLDWAYHGNLSSLIEISPYKFNRRGGSGPGPRVRVCELPDPYRGRFGADGPRYAEDIRSYCGEAPPAAFVHESIPGCAGQIELAPGYLAEAYRLVRAEGGLCVADEVQCGFGRVGSHLWAFEEHGVIPDIVTLGKPIGNGHPIGAVVTTPDVARSFHNGMEYFNTFGGNPVSCAVGLAVLDVLTDERLMANAAIVGGRFKAALTELADRHDVVGDVRGRGLFLGVDLIAYRENKAPATEFAKELVEAAKRRGVLLSTDGPHENVLKIKPPLVLSSADADHAVSVIDHVLSLIQ